MGEARILVIGDGSGEPLGQHIVEILDGRNGYRADLIERSVSDARAAFDHSADLVALVLPASRRHSRQLLLALEHRRAGRPVLLVLPSTEMALDPDDLRFPPVDFVVAPVHPPEVLVRTQRLLAGGLAKRRTPQDLEVPAYGEFIGEHASIAVVKRKLLLASRCDVPVLLTGETGTGKEICARAIHHLGSRSKKPFLPVNCSAIPVDLFESEVFGYKKGAFTGAATSRTGLIAEAEGGTFFLDEVEALNPSAQAKLLRFLQDQTYYALGSSQLNHSDVRIIAASNRELGGEVSAGFFREDLYYRLAVLDVVLPPLRERPSDIPLLVRHFIDQLSDRSSGERRDLSAEAMDALCRYSWPGNVRQLANVLQQALIFSEKPIIGLESLSISPPPPRPNGRGTSMKEAKALTIESFEKQYISDLLASHQGNVTRAARAAGKERRAFGRLIKKYGLDPRP
jgi:two-component system, NtrC family, response regulator GlrR